MSEKKQLTRSRSNRMLGGVCGGLGEYFDVDPTWIRIAFVALILFGMGSPLIGYLLLWLIIPRAELEGAQTNAPTRGELPETTLATADESEMVAA